jgi:hypothetical protein
MLSDPRDELGNSEIPGIREIPDTFVIREIGNCPEKTCFYRIRSAQQVPPDFQEIGTFSDIFFRNVTNLQKSAKKCKKRKKCKSVPKTLKFWVFYRK